VQPAVENKPTPKKLSFNEQKELEALPDLIATLEKEQTEIIATLADGDIYRVKPEQAKTLQLRLNEIEAEIELSLEKWNDLESRSK
jgi:ATP-binding cassette subfamily F protein uup